MAKAWEVISKTREERGKKMTITDKKALREIRLANCPELAESVETYPEDQRDGRSDLQFVADEISYFVSMYYEGGTVFSEGLEWAKEVLLETKNGKVMPVFMPSCRPKYKEWDIIQARNCVNEFRRLTNAKKRLEDAGYYGRW